MRIGLDFDNTIVCYDRLFHRVAREQGLIPADLPVTKLHVRDHLRRIGQEDAWTAMQGLVYGGRMAEAEAYPGAIAFLRRARAAGHELSIISHKTRYPFLGHRFDLHQAARDWIAHNLVSDGTPLVPPDQVFFLPTKAEKLAQIGASGCAIYLDDLPEILLADGFPAGARPVLFDPDDHHGSAVALPRIRHWAGFDAELSQAVPLTAIAALWHDQFGGAEPPLLEPLPSSGNNRLFIASQGDARAVVKWYYADGAGQRDRLDVEWRFLRYAESIGLTAAPTALARDDAARVALHQFLPGRRLAIEEIGPDQVRAAAALLAALNHPSARASADCLPDAAEACFSTEAHFALIDQRLDRLAEVAPSDAIDRAAITLIGRLSQFWAEAKPAIAAALDPLGHDVPVAERILSPSDFGFHNALVDANGALRFIDFEYAGWDDPAKTLADFFLQPAIPIDRRHWALFAEIALAEYPAARRHQRRAEALLPVFALKWCCIMLNPFLPERAARSRFADPGTAESDRRTRQLAKADAAFSQLTGQA